MVLIVFLLIAYGISNIMVFSTIFSKWREFWIKHSPKFFGELFSCMICLPFWVGAFLSTTVISISGFYYNIDNIFYSTFIDACLTSGGVWLIHTIQENLEHEE